MKVATPMFCSLRKVTHFWAVSMVSTTMLSSAPQLEEIATSYFSSMAPRSPYKGNNSFKKTSFNLALWRKNKMNFTATRSVQLLCSVSVCYNIKCIKLFFTNLPKMPGILPVFFCCIRASKTFPRLRLEDRELLVSYTFCLISLTTSWVSLSNFISCPSCSSSCTGQKKET